MSKLTYEDRVEIYNKRKNVNVKIKTDKNVKVKS